MNIPSKSLTIQWTTVESSMGECIILATTKGVCWLGTPGRSLDEGVSWIKSKISIDSVVNDDQIVPLSVAKRELTAYFSGESVKFSCSLDLYGTLFQKTVWQELQNVTYGTMCTYGEIAKALNHPTASRAVGAALGANPISIIIPCHRVIGVGKKLTGYAGGLAIKSWLLSLEGITLF